MATRDYYQILGVSPDSEDVVIQAAYRALMRRYHPDTNKSADAGRRATEINEAYAVLSDPIRKANYDQELRENRGKSQTNGGSNASPPPPPPPPQQSDAPIPPPRRPWDDLGTRIAVGLIGTFVIIVAVGAMSESGSSAADNNMAVENLEAGNLVVENDTDPLEDNVVEAEAPPAPATLATLSQAPVQYDDVESAAGRFAKVLTSTGMSGARTLSEKCHAGVKAEPSWAAADWCAAFDYAAAHIDREVSRSAGWPANPYFQFQAENQADRYKEAGTTDYFVSTRLTSIKEAAESAADDAMMQQIAKLKAQAAPVPESSTTQQTPSAPEESRGLTQRWLENVLNPQPANHVGGNG